MYGLEHLLKRREPVPGFRWKVSASMKRLSVRRQKHRHWPATMPGKNLNGRHIDLVNIRTFLTIHLDCHEMFIEYVSGCLILKGFMLHDMAPVASGISNA